MKSRLFKAIILGLVIGVVAMLLSPFRFALNLEENTGLGLLFKLRGVEKPSGEVVVVVLERSDRHPAAEWIAEAYRSGGKTMLFGNGGSAADAQHIATEFNARLTRDRPALPSIALTVNASDLTAIGNDYGFERIFARLIEAHGKPGDVAIAISTSGNSLNVLRAVDEARSRGIRSIGLLGRGGGKLLDRVEVDRLYAEGGATAVALVRRMGWTSMRVLCEWATGVVTLQVQGRAAPLLSIKPGSYAWPKAILA